MNWLALRYSALPSFRCCIACSSFSLCLESAMEPCQLAKAVKILRRAISVPSTTSFPRKRNDFIFFLLNGVQCSADYSVRSSKWSFQKCKQHSGYEKQAEDHGPPPASCSFL